MSELLVCLQGDAENHQQRFGRQEQLFRTQSVNQRQTRSPSVFNFPPSFVSRQDAGQRSSHACTPAQARVCVCVR